MKAMGMGVILCRQASVRALILYFLPGYLILKP